MARIRYNPAHLRLARNEDQSVFYGRIGVSQSCGSRYENENRAVPDTVQKLLHLTYVLKINPDTGQPLE